MRNTDKTRHIRQRGYSLVEVAIALAVVGLILGGAVLPIGNQLREKAYQRANLQVGEAIDAVVGYSITNRSPGFTYLHNDNTSYRKYGFRLSRIPAGRPYLPCPDIDGDGIEDRTELVIPTLSSELGFVYGRNEDGIVFSQRPTDSLEANEPIEFSNTPLGSCEVYSGSLPWRTLGLPSSDPWGSRLTYAVNPMFATAAFGFDQQTRATGHLNILETEFIYDGQARAYPNSNIMTSFFYHPIIPCSVDAAPSASPFHECHQGMITSSANGSFPASLDVGSQNIYSVPTGGYAVVQQFDRRNSYVLALSPYVPINYYVNMNTTFFLAASSRSVSDGLPFVIISHGANRLGAETDDLNSAKDCADEPLENQRPFEYYNSLLGICATIDNNDQGRAQTTGSISVHAVRRAALKSSDPALTSEYLSTSYYPGNGVFDDVVGWLTRRELQATMHDRGVFPLPETFHGLLAGQATYRQ